jgi:hypothetical protein
VVQRAEEAWKADPLQSRLLGRVKFVGGSFFEAGKPTRAPPPKVCVFLPPAAPPAHHRPTSFSVFSASGFPRSSITLLQRWAGDAPLIVGHVRVRKRVLRVSTRRLSPIHVNTYYLLSHGSPCHPPMCV